MSMNNYNPENERFTDRLIVLVLVVPVVSFAVGCLITFLLMR
ncbi:hypothetical protein B0I21_11148 [Sphingobacterium paludis]|uniref:Uncharacterized protein n=1 Tax=Sphingobacterium paludis TaxID=1476465 RepID=A0A4R7CV53_9SPHI|nr:hypothetical protein B0I21_11148 [Sphingobacterium paludis]